MRLCAVIHHGGLEEYYWYVECCDRRTYVFTGHSVDAAGLTVNMAEGDDHVREWSKRHAQMLMNLVLGRRFTQEKVQRWSSSAIQRS